MSSGSSADGRVRILIVSSGTTLGQKRSDSELSNAIEMLGYSVRVCRPNFVRWRRFQKGKPLLDLTEALLLAAETRRAVKQFDPTCIVFSTTTATFFQPRRVLNKAAVRFDALALENRPGVHNVIQHILERRARRHIPLHLPYSSKVTDKRLRYFQRCSRVVALGVCLPPPPDPARCTRRVVLAYAGDAKKKQLELLVKAWADVEPGPFWKLWVTGIDEREAASYLKKLGQEVPPGVRWLGRLRSEEFRELMVNSRIFIAASRYEDFGISQLEALRAGSILVTVRSEGPFEALDIVEEIDKRLVSEAMSASSLSHSLEVAMNYSGSDLANYREMSARSTERFSEAAYTSRLRDRILGPLVGICSV